MKILINALSGNGDALMFSPALKLLKSKLPDCEIDMLVMFKSVEQLYSSSPHLYKIHLIDFIRQEKSKSFKQVMKLRKNKYDVSINVYPSNRAEYNFINYLEGAKKRIAKKYIASHPARFQFLNTHLIYEVKDRHNVLQNLDLIKPVTDVKDEDAGELEIFIGEAEKRKAKQWIVENNLFNSTLIGFHAGSALFKNHIHKRWAKEKFAELGVKLMKMYNARILLFGNEFDINNDIKQMMNGRGILASTENYMDSAARMQYCKLFVSNDSAFMHTAAALQLPVAAVFAYTNANELFPWKTAHIVVRRDLICSPCFFNSPRPVICKWDGEAQFKCIKDISVEEVLDACRILIQEIPNDSYAGD